MPEESAVIVDSAPTELTPEQSTEFWNTGKMPSRQDSAPAKKEAVPDSAPEKPAVNASDPAPEKDKPRKKPENYGEERFQELANENRRLKKELEDSKRKPEPRETKQPPQAAPEEPKAPPPFKQFLEKFFSDNKDKSYEEGVEAWAEAREKYREIQHQKKIDEALQSERQRIAQEAATRDLKSRVDEGKSRYEDFDAKVWPTLKSVFEDQQVPFAVKAMLNRSDVLVDLLYAIGKDNVEKFTDLAKSDPGAAIEKLIELQSDVRRELKALKEPPKEVAKIEAQPKPQAPKPPAEVGGRGASSESADKAAARAGNFSAFSAEMNRQARDAMRP